MAQDYYRCVDCDWHGPETEIHKEVFFQETRLEPSETIWYCPLCFKTESLEKDSTAYCEWCGDEPVPDEGEICFECLTCYGDEIADAEIDDLLTN